ncbi:MAG: hypothetical protein E7517_00105 [Ruminococcaceae bacterium]|nr:hypothetical protein [Oscillospiraceae bacterium]
MSSLIELGAKVGTIQGKIDLEKAELLRLEQSYNSLLRLQTDVQRQCSDFSQANKEKEGALNQVKAISSDNTVAKKYYSGMKKLLSGTGNRITGFVFAILLEKIRIELLLIRNRITHCEDSIIHAQKDLDKAKDNYRKEKEKMDQEKA